MPKRRNVLMKYLKDRGLRQTKSKAILIDFFLQNQRAPVSLKKLNSYMQIHLPEIDRTTIYRNIEKLIDFDVIQELEIPKLGKAYQFIFEKNISHYYTCKSCRKIKKGNEDLFSRVEKALKDVHDFSKANFSVVFYGYCADCRDLVA